MERGRFQTAGILRVLGCCARGTGRGQTYHRHRDLDLSFVIQMLVLSMLCACSDQGLSSVFQGMSDANQPESNSLPLGSLVSGLHFRGTLPHLKKEGAAYFVTFRLADSLPAHTVARLRHERNAILSQAQSAKSPLTWHEERQLLNWYCDKVEGLLDAGHGACWLSKPEVADLVAGALKHFDSQRYELRAWVLMPNHVHAIVWPMPGYTLSEILHSWKSYTSSAANKMLRRSGDFWQAESFDHWIRDHEEQARLVAYVHGNPVKAGFCRLPEDWRWSSAKGGTR